MRFILGLALFLVCCIGLIGFVAYEGSKTTERVNKQLYLEGQRAAQVGLPPNANPLIDSPYYARIWLDGYMDYIEEKKSNEMDQ
jgi:hypothetical protein